MERDLKDWQWDLIKSDFPPNGHVGRQWKDHRSTLNGILWIISTGAPWRALPCRYGNWKTVYDKFNRWSRNGFWKRIFCKLQEICQKEGKIDWEVFCIDGSSIRAHHAAAGARNCKTMNEPSDHCLGRSRGGYGTKIHYICDGNGLPIAVELSPGHRHESQFCLSLIDAVIVKGIVGRPRKRPINLVCDKAYNSRIIIAGLKKRKIQPVVPSKANQEQNSCFNQMLYRRRNIVERSIGWIKEYRRVATRYEKLARNYLSAIYLCFISVCFKKYITFG